MRTALNIKDDLLNKASKLTGIKETTPLVRRGLGSFIAIESGKRLARLGGSEKGLKPIPCSRAGGGSSMVLVDTSVWADHLRRGTVGLDAPLSEGQVLCHPFIIGELACGNVKNRPEILSLLQTLPAVRTAEEEEVLRFIEEHRLMGKGLGSIEMHLLASSLLSQVPLWTLDKGRGNAAVALDIRYPSTPKR